MFISLKGDNICQVQAKMRIGDCLNCSSFILIRPSLTLSHLLPPTSLLSFFKDISGVPGTGKTATVHRVLDLLQKAVDNGVKKTIGIGFLSIQFSLLLSFFNFF